MSDSFFVFAFRASLILISSDSTRCWRFSSKDFVYVDMVADLSAAHLVLLVPPHTKGALLD